MESMQLRHLEQAERHIVQAEMAMTRLDLATELLRSKNRSTESEERSRAIMQKMLDQFYKHRELILREIYGFKGAPSPKHVLSGKRAARQNFT